MQIRWKLVIQLPHLLLHALHHERHRLPIRLRLRRLQLGCCIGHLLLCLRVARSITARPL